MDRIIRVTAATSTRNIKEASPIKRLKEDYWLFPRFHNPSN